MVSGIVVVFAAFFSNNRALLTKCLIPFDRLQKSEN